MFQFFHFFFLGGTWVDSEQKPIKSEQNREILVEKLFLSDFKPK